MTFLGLTLIALGGSGLLAGAYGFAIARLDGASAARLSGERVRPYLRYGPVLAAVAAPVLMVGIVMIDARRIPDSLGALLLVASLLATLVTLGVPVARRVRGRGSAVPATVAGAFVLALIAIVIVLAIEAGDLLSVLVLLGFVLVLLGAIAAIVGALWLVGSLIRRRGRASSARFAWASVSLAVAGGLGIVILAPLPPSAPESMSSAAELDQFLEDLVESNSPPGISVVVVKDGETVYNEAFGLADGPNEIAATPDTVYHWFSTTKIVTAIATMQLVEQGLVDLDDPVSDYLSFFEPKYPSASSEPVTVVQLLNHSSGLPDNVPAVVSWVHLDEEPALDQTGFLQDKLPSYDDLRFEPGSSAVYTNVGYYVLGGLIEQVTGQSYEEYVVEHVLEPLGMTNTRFEYTEAMVAHDGVGAHPLADFLTAFLPFMSAPWPSEYIREYDGGNVWFNRFLFDGSPPSGLVGPAPEMARLGAAILNGGELDGARILSQETVDTLLNDRHVDVGSSSQWSDYTRRHGDDFVQGIGWRVVRDQGRLHHSHGGGGPAFAALMRLYPDEGLGIVLLANGTNLEDQRIADGIATIDW